MKNPCLPAARSSAKVAALALCSLLASCAVLGNKPAPALHTYTLNGATPTAGTGAARVTGGPVLLVEAPHAAPGYDSARMVYVRQPQTLEVFANSVWVDTPARMLAPLLLDQLQHSGQFRAVLLAPSAAKAGLRLDTTVLQLQQDFLQVPSTVHLRLQLNLIDNATRAVLASRTLDGVQTASSEDAAGGAWAAQMAVQQVLQQAAAFVHDAVAKLPAD